MAEPNKMQEALKKAWAMHEANLDKQRKSVTDDLKEKRKQPDPLQVDFLERKAMKPAFFEWLEIRFDAATKQQVQEQLVPRCDYVKAYIEKNVPIDKCTDHFKGFRDWLIMQIDYLKGQIIDGTVPILPDDHDEGATPMQDAANNRQPSNTSTPASGSSALSVSSPSQSETTSQGSTGTKQRSTASPGKDDPASKLEAFNKVANLLKGKSMIKGKQHFETYRNKYEDLASDWDYVMVVQALKEVDNDLADNKKTPRGSVEKKLLNYRKSTLERLKKEKKPATPADQPNDGKPKDTPPKPTSQQNTTNNTKGKQGKKGNTPTNSKETNGQKGNKTP